MIYVLKFHTPKSDKMAYANFKGAVWSGSTRFAISLNILIKKQIHKKQTSMESCFKFLDIYHYLLQKNGPEWARIWRQNYVIFITEIIV